MTTKGILGKKVGMTQVFTENGELVPVTVVKVDSNVVLQVKTMENDGYEAIQLGFDDLREVLTNKPLKVMRQKQILLLSASFVKFAMLSLENIKLETKLRQIFSKLETSWM